MRNLTIHRHSMVVADLVEFMDVYQHDAMRVLFNLVVNGTADAPVKFLDAFPNVRDSLSEAGLAKFTTKFHRAHGVMLDQFGHLASRIRTDAWVEAAYIPAGHDSFMVVSDIYEADGLYTTASMLKDSMESTVLKSSYWAKTELGVLTEHGYDPEATLLKIILSVIAGESIEVIARGGEDEATYDSRVQYLTAIRSIVHGKIHEVIYKAAKRYQITVSVNVEASTFTLHFYPAVSATDF